MRKRERKFRNIHILMIIILLLVVVISVVLIKRNKASNSQITIKKIEKQNVEKIEISYIVDQGSNIVLENPEKIQEYIKNNKLQIFGKELSEDIDFEFTYTYDIFENTAYVFNETYKGVTIANLDINVLINNNENKLISINGNIVEPEEFNVEVIVNKEEALKIFTKEMEKINKKEDKDSIEIKDYINQVEENEIIENVEENNISENESNEGDEIKNQIHYVNDEFIVHGYEFFHQNGKMIVDANLGGIVNIGNEE